MKNLSTIVSIIFCSLVFGHSYGQRINVILYQKHNVLIRATLKESKENVYDVTKKNKSLKISYNITIVMRNEYKSIKINFYDENKVISSFKYSLHDPFEVIDGYRYTLKKIKEEKTEEKTEEKIKRLISKYKFLDQVIIRNS